MKTLLTISTGLICPFLIAGCSHFTSKAERDWVNQYRLEQRTKEGDRWMAEKAAREQEQLKQAKLLEEQEIAKQKKITLVKEASVKRILTSHLPWEYIGKKGPTAWGNLNEEYSKCEEGEMQSPIDLRWKTPAKGGDLFTHYNSSEMSVIDNGHTVKFFFEGKNTVNIRGQVYTLKELHFHSGSEHSLSGSKFPVEMHMVHKNENGEIAVLGVFFKEGQKNAAFEKLAANFPSKKFKKMKLEGVNFNPALLLPNSKHHYHYTGSLTTPPCSENVNWNVFNNAVELSAEQLSAFRGLYKDNFRPLQSLNDREVVNF